MSPSSKASKKDITLVHPGRPPGRRRPCSANTAAAPTSHWLLICDWPTRPAHRQARTFVAWRLYVANRPAAYVRYRPEAGIFLPSSSPWVVIGEFGTLVTLAMRDMIEYSCPL